MAVELADLHRGADLGVLDRHAAQGDVLAQYRRDGAAGDHAHLVATGVHAVAVGGGLAPVHLQAHQPSLRVVTALQEGVTADEVVLLGLERHGEADPGLVGVGLVAELVPGEDEAGLDAQHVERGQPHGHQAVGGAGLEDGVPHRGCVRGVAEHFEAELAGVAGARHHQRDPVVVADTGDGEPEPSQLRDRRLVGTGPDHLLQDLSAVGPLDLEVVELLGGAAHPCLQPQALGLLPQPHAAVAQLPADPAEVLAPEPEHGAVVDHAAGVEAHGGVRHLAVGELADVAGDAGLHQQLGVGAGDLVLAQRGEVYGRRGLPAGPVLLDGAVGGVGIGQPVAAVLAEAAGQPGGAGMEPGLLGQLGLGVCGHADRRRFLEPVGRGIDPHRDVGGVPGVGRVDVVGA